jgi:hypothetical protein
MRWGGKLPFALLSPSTGGPERASRSYSTGHLSSYGAKLCASASLCEFFFPPRPVATARSPRSQTQHEILEQLGTYRFVFGHASFEQLDQVLVTLFDESDRQ